MKALALALVLVGGTARAQTCAELLDGGVPPPVVKVAPGDVVAAPGYLVPPARMCLIGQSLTPCEPSPAPVLVGVVVGLLVGAGAAAIVAAATR